MDPAKVEVSPAIPLPVALSSALVRSMRAATYARVSTLEQDEARQHDALVAAGCQRVFVDKVSGKLQHRPALDAMFEQLRPGDSVTVWRLDRLGRSLRHLIDTVADAADGATSPTST
jgi:DNA invertase Pin-like site-specific DNA recombinase